MIERYVVWVAERRGLTLLFSAFVVIAVWLLERHQEEVSYIWVVRVAAMMLILVTGVFMSYARLQSRGRPIESPYPHEPLDIVKILKTLQSLEPHCIWAGKMGQLWGVHVRGHQRDLPFAQNRKEVWVMHLEGYDVQVDGRTAVHSLKAGQWLKLPEGVGPGGIKSDGAYFLWSTQT